MKTGQRRAPMQPLILHQFEISHFSEKIRFVLDY
jgi:hypothetical protein